MIKPIAIYGDEILRESSQNISRGSKLDVNQLIDDMFETMHKANGIGLSAIQIGVPLRLFVIEAHLEDLDFHFRGVFINPRITYRSEETIKHPEGCLSIPRLVALVERPEVIEMEWFDEKWVHHKERFDKYRARIIQHEYDHLEGNLYVDNLDRMWRNILKRPLEEIRTRETDIPYLWKRE